MKVFVIFLLDMLMKPKTNLLYKNNMKIKLNFFSHNKLKFQTRT